MNEVEKLFVKELSDLCKKYNVRISEENDDADYYGGEYEGDAADKYYFYGSDIYLRIDEEFFEQI